MLDPCPGCGALFPPSTGPTHRYIGASPGCWALYAPLSAGQTPGADLIASSRVPVARTPITPRQVHPAAGALVVDAYATQHHGEPSPQAIQSVGVHLLTLHGVLRCGVDPAQALWLRRRPLRTRGAFRWLDPPPLGAALTIRHLFPGGGVTEPSSPAEYVQSVYDAWAAGHAATLAEWYERLIVAQ